MTDDTTPRVYVGTYHKYASGSIKGEWLDLDDYSDSDEFYEACAELHADESDPEYMFQDWENIPEGMISESGLNDAVWEWIALDDDDRELLAVYSENIQDGVDIETARDAYLGTFDSPEDWAYQFRGLEGMPEHLRYYFDYEAYARDAHMDGDVTFAEHGRQVWVFRNH